MTKKYKFDGGTYWIFMAVWLFHTDLEKAGGLGPLFIIFGLICVGFALVRPIKEQPLEKGQ